ncbi:ribonuclease H-like YkuK family protein [Numidum massiliense]|uniref:ribonuclease H-like YkuK family protein n=1 Tax=Numidum massiliense TaxID=1522315 RepID=UPI0028FCD143|nr:ribonuclease H-like YkuK family protein [Numidum massiliense]
MHPRKGQITLEEMIRDIQSFMAEDENAHYKIVIGTDSQTTQQQTLFVTAVIVHRIGKGARFYTRKMRSQPLHNLRYRIYRETEYSLDLMQHLKEKGFLEELLDLPLEIHLDVGQRGESRKLIQEVVGWVTAVGYTVKIKPDAYGASAVADRFTK